MFKYILTLVAVTALAACSPADFKQGVATAQKKASHIHLSSVGAGGIINNCTPGVPGGDADSDSSSSDSNSSDSSSSDSNSSDSSSSDSNSSDSNSSDSDSSSGGRGGGSCSHGSPSGLTQCTDGNLNCICDEVEAPGPVDPPGNPGTPGDPGTPGAPGDTQL